MPEEDNTNLWAKQVNLCFNAGMRIGIDCRMFSSRFTGIGRYTHELVKEILDMNHKLSHPHQIVLFFNEPEYSEFRTLYPVTKVLVKAKHYSFAEQTRFLFKLWKEKCDVVHFPHFNVPMLYRRPYSVTIHDLTLSLFPGKKMTKWYQRLAYHLTIRNTIHTAKKVVAISDNTKKDIQGHFKIGHGKIEVIYNGVNPEFKILEHPKKHPKPFLLYTGVWRSHKNLPKMIEAFAKVLEKHDLNLIITGKEDPFYPEVKETAEKLGVRGRVIFTGLVDEHELINLYNAASVFVFPSLYEGFGLPPLEAMACGTPVVASNSSSIPEICGEGNAVFFDPKNADDIAAKICEVYENESLREKLIEHGKKRVEEFSWKKMAETTFELILRNR